MFLSREIDIKLCHVSSSVSRDQYTALPLVGVLVKIMKLKVGSAPGPDGISVKFLQTFCDEISVP